jgi:hypothetical protein
MDRGYTYNLPHFRSKLGHGIRPSNTEYKRMESFNLSGDNLWDSTYNKYISRVRFKQCEMY